MRLVLESHPDIFCYDESKSYAVLQNALREEAASAKAIGFKIPRWTEQFLSDVMVDDGAEGPCINFYSGQPILYLMREVKDTIASMLKLQMGDSNWCSLWAPRIIAAKVADDPAYASTCARELAIADTSENRLIGLAALYWKYKTAAFFTYRQRAMPVLPVSYEALVSDPEPVLRQVCGFLSLPFNESVLRHPDHAHAEISDAGLAIGNTDPIKPIGADSVGQWRSYLSATDIDLISRVVGDLPGRVDAVLMAESAAAAEPQH